MKKLIRVLAISLSVLMLTGLLAACGGSTSSSTKDYIVLDESLDNELYGIGFRKGDAGLGLEVQKILDELISSGKAAEISRKWFGEDILLKDGEYQDISEAQPGDGSLDALKSRGKFVVGLDDQFPPMGFRDEGNNIVGFDIDLAREVAKKLGVELVLQPIDWDSKEMELSTGRIDCIWNGMTINEERKAAMFFAKPYLSNRQVIIVPKDSDVKTVADLAGKKVGLQKGSSSLDALQKSAVFDQVGELIELGENVTVFMELKTGRIDAFVVDEVAGRYILANN